MKGVLMAAVVIGMAAAAGYFYWQNRDPSFNYRLTVTVESGGQTYTASTVTRVRIKIQENWAPALVPIVTGDAVVVEVPGRSPIFVLMSAKTNVDWDSSLAFHIFQDRFPVPLRTRSNVEALVALRETREIPRDQYPTLVAFRDITRPETVYEVSPDNMSPPLDEGARVVSMTIEMTDDRVTYQVEPLLPWLDEIRGNLLGKSIVTTSELADNLGVASFRKRGY
jgi:hypothetical protein